MTDATTPDLSTPLALVQEAYARFGRGDIPGLLALAAPDIEWQFVGDRAAPYTATVRGHGQVGEWFAAVVAADDIREFEPLRMLAGGDVVTVIGRERTVARATGREFSCAWVHVWELREGRVARFWGMLDSEASGAARRA